MTKVHRIILPVSSRETLIVHFYQRSVVVVVGVENVGKPTPSDPMESVAETKVLRTVLVVISLDNRQTDSIGFDELRLPLQEYSSTVLFSVR